MTSLCISRFFPTLLSALTLFGVFVHSNVLTPKQTEEEVCAFIVDELIIEVGGVPVSFGFLEVCLCIEIIPTFIYSNAVTLAALELLDELIVLAALGELFEGSPVCSLISPSQGLKKRDTYVLSDDLCGRGLTLCGVSSSSYSKTSWECLDTQNGLESCGGCAVGILGHPATGVDCTAIEGVEDVACRVGKCQVSACASGWNVSECGTMCVPETRPSKHRVGTFAHEARGHSH